MSPLPAVAGPPRPSSSISSQSGPIAIVQVCAREWRTTLVTPSRTTQPNSSACAGSASIGARGARLDAGGSQHLLGARELARQRQVAVAGDGGADVGERATA